MRAPRYFALDISKYTGWAIAEGDRIIKSGVRDFSVRSSEHIGHRGIKFDNFLREIHKNFHDIDEIYYEKIQFTANRHTSDGGELYKGFLMLLNMYAASHCIPMFGVWPGTLKKDFAGHGHAEKEDMCAMAHSLGWKGGMLGTKLHDDEADAIALLVTQVRNKYGVNLRF